MSRTDVRILSKQSRAVYDVLRRRGSLTAREIAQLLGVLPTSVYRSTQQLLALGMVRRSSDYPAVFEAFSPDAALGSISIIVDEQLKTFGSQRQADGYDASPGVSFFASRSALLHRTDRDASKARLSIDFAVSGLEVPNETVLAYRRAADRGARIRALVQRRDEAKSERLQTWQGIGVDVRYASSLGIRLFLFDSRIAYVSSYSGTAKQEAIGVRFEYAPLANLFSSVFEEWWKLAEPCLPRR